MLFYKLGDNLIGTMSNLFYLDLGFTSLEIAGASKIFGMWATILGGCCETNDSHIKEIAKLK